MAGIEYTCILASAARYEYANFGMSNNRLYTTSNPLTPPSSTGRSYHLWFCVLYYDVYLYVGKLAVYSPPIGLTLSTSYVMQGTSTFTGTLMLTTLNDASETPASDMIVVFSSELAPTVVDMDGTTSNVSAFSAATKAITLTNVALPAQVGGYYVLLYIKGYSPAARQMVGYATFSVADPNPSPLWPSATAMPPYALRRLNDLHSGLEYTVTAAQNVVFFKNASSRTLVIPANTWVTTDLLSDRYNNSNYVPNTMSDDRRVSYAQAKNRLYVAPGVYGGLGACAAWRTADGTAHTPAYEAWIKATFDASMFKHATRGDQPSSDQTIAQFRAH